MQENDSPKVIQESSEGILPTSATVQECSAVDLEKLGTVHENPETIHSSSYKKQKCSEVDHVVLKEVQKCSDKKTRTKHKCPFPSCSAVVVHLPRHMRSCHGWSQKDSKGVLSVFGLRKERQAKTGKKKRQYKSFMCPVHGCQAVVKRIHNHLTDFHKFQRSSSKYKHYLLTAEKHEVLILSSSESTPLESSSSEEIHKPCFKSLSKKKKTRVPSKSIFQQVYDSTDDEDYIYPDNYHSAAKGIQKSHISIFKADCKSESSSSDSSLSESENSEQEKIVKVAKLKDQLSVSSANDSSGNQSLGERCYGENSSGENTSKDNSSGENSSGENSSGKNSSEEYSSEGNSSGENFSNDEYSTNNLPESMHQNIAVFQTFSQWLQGPDGGRKDHKCAQQCSRQVQLVVKAIKPSSPSIKELFDRKILRDSWLNDFEKKKQPGTVKSYLGALNLFFLYLKCEQPDELAPISTELLGNLSDTMKQWSKSCKNLVKDRFWEKRMDDLSKLKTPENVQEFDCSKIARDAVRIIGEHQEDLPETMPSHFEYVTVRDYLLTILCINNGSRSGSLANMTLGEYQTALKDEDDYVINVKKHKTFTTHGPAHIVMSSTVYHWVGIFITQFRNKIGNVDKEGNSPVFVTWNLQPMDSSHIGKQIGSCWGKVFGKHSSSGGATSFRKAAVSAMQEHNEEGRDKLASLMVHRKETADRYYLLKQKSKEAAIASRNLRSIMHSKGKTTGKVLTRHQWTSEQEESLKSLFESEIKARKISLEQVKNKTKYDAAFKGYDSVKIYNKIRQIISSTVETGTLPLPQGAETPKDRLSRIGINCIPKDGNQLATTCEKSSEWTPSLFSAAKTTSSDTTGKLFNPHETELFRTVFHDLIHSNQAIKRAQVVQRVKDNPELCHLTKRYTPVQLSDKVRTERKILQRQKDK